MNATATSEAQSRAPPPGIPSPPLGVPSLTPRSPTARSRVVTTLVLCFCTSILEGFDLQSMGIAAPKLGPEFRLSKELLGYVLMASPLGLFFGAFLGGRLADFWGRK